MVILDADLDALWSEAQHLCGCEPERLVSRYVEPDSYYPMERSEARLTMGDVPVWAVIGHLVVERDIPAVAKAYDLPDNAVIAALAYYRNNRRPIDERLAANSAVH